MSRVFNLLRPHSRLAPTPSGFLHIGNVYSFVLTSLLAKSNAGSLRLRIDDIDSERTQDVFIDDILSQLEWLGIQIDEGPSSVEEFKKRFSQLLRLHEFDQALDELSSSHSLYACLCSRKDSVSNSSYSGNCREKNIPLDTPGAQLRIRTNAPLIIHFNDLLAGEQTIDLSHQMTDFVVRRKNGLPSYQLVSCVEDLKFKMDLIVRGEDLRLSTAAQVFLAQKLEPFKTPSSTNYLHHLLLEEQPGQKLSKSHQSLSLKRMREQGISKDEVYTFLARAFGFHNDKIHNFHDLLEATQNHELQLHTVPTISWS